MLLARAFVFGVSTRALLAVAAVAVSVVYALVAAGSLSGLGGEGAVLEEARADPGVILFDSDGGDLQRASLPANAVAVDRGERDGVRLATLTPWPHEADQVFRGPYAAGGVSQETWTAGWNITDGPEPYQPWDTYLLPPELFAAAVPDREGLATHAYVPGAEQPSEGAGSTPWRGVAAFYEEGADQLRANLYLVVVASGAIAAFLAAGFVRLEVLARRADLKTVEALSGPESVRRLVLLRATVLAAAGLFMGIIAALVLLRILSAAIGASLSVPIPVVLAVTVAAGGGSALFAGAVGIRALGGAKGSGRGITTRRFPGPLRFLFVTPRLFPATFAATLVTVGILSVVIASSAAPAALFGAASSEETVLLETDGNPLRGTADRFTGETARFIDGVDAGMPETFAPTVWNGRSIMVKGTDLEAWQHYREPRLVAGSWPTKEGEATVGVRAAEVHQIGEGHSLLVPASYHIGAERLEIVGVHETDGLADDQLVTDLATAGRLAGLAPDKASMLRLRISTPGLTWSELAPRPRIEVLDVEIFPKDPVPLTPATVQIHVANFAAGPSERLLSLRLNGNLTERLSVQLDGHSREVHQIPVIVPAGESLRIEVNPTEDVRTRPAALKVVVPDVARPGVPFEVTIERRGAPLQGATVLVDGIPVATADSAGRAEVVVDGARLATVSAEHGSDQGGATVRVAPEAWDDEAHLVVERLAVGRPVDENTTHFRATVQASVVNVGGADFNGSVTWTVDGEEHEMTALRLESGDRRALAWTAIAPFGEHYVGLRGLQARVIGQPGGQEGAAAPGPAESEQDRPKTVEELLERREAAQQTASSAEAVKGLLAQVFESLEKAVVLVVLATFLHAGALVWVAVVREVRERTEIVTAVRALGAGHEQIRARVARDAVLSLLPGIVAGVVAAAAGLSLLSRVGFPAAFGHTLPVDLSLGLLLRISLGLVVIGLIAALYALASTAESRPAVQGRRPLSELLEETV